MSEKATPTAPIQELAPEQSFRQEIMTKDDAEWAKSMGLTTEKPKEEPKAVAAEEKPPEEEVAAPEAEKEEAVEEETKPDEPEAEKKEPKKYDFSLADKEGELEVPEDLKITYKANGKIRKDLPLEKVIQFAKMGHYNHEREQELEAREQSARSAVEQANQYRDVIEQYKAQVSKLLEDQDYVDAARERWLQYNTPEAKAQRYQSEAQQAKEELARQREAGAVAAATQTYFVPALEALLGSNPLVSEYEVMGKYQEMIQPHFVNGRLPAAKLQTAFELIETKLSHWVNGLQEERAEADAAKRKESDKAKREAAAAKRQLARRVAPTGGAGPEKKTALTDNDSAQAWLNQMFPTK